MSFYEMVNRASDREFQAILDRLHNVVVSLGIVVEKKAEGSKK